MPRVCNAALGVAAPNYILAILQGKIVETSIQYSNFSAKDFLLRSSHGRLDRRPRFMPQYVSCSVTRVRRSDRGCVLSVAERSSGVVRQSQSREEQKTWSVTVTYFQRTNFLEIFWQIMKKYPKDDDNCQVGKYSSGVVAE